MTKSHAEKMGKLLPYIFILTFIAGVTAGAVFARISAQAAIFNITTASKMTVFVNSFKSFLKPCLIIWISGFTRYSVYFSSGTLVYRGGILGFVTGSVIKTYGIGAALSATLPQNIVFFPFLLFISLAAAGQKKGGHAEYIILLLLTGLVCSLSALIDTYITSVLIKLTF